MMAVDIEREAIQSEPKLELVTPERKKKRRFEFITPDAFCAPVPPIKYVIEALDLCPGPPAMFAGFGYSGKTMSAQALLLAIATGGRAWGFFTPAMRGPVVHIDHEQGENLTRMRYHRLARAAGVDVRELATNVRLACHPRVYLNSSAAEDAYLEATDGAVLCVIDSLAASAPGDDENASSIRTLLDLLNRVSSKTGCAFLVLHHAGKPSKEARDPRALARGASAIFDACGSVLNLVGTGAAGAPIECVHTKAKSHGRSMDPFNMRIEDVAIDGNPRGGLRVTVDTTPPEQEAEREVKGWEDLLARVVDTVRHNPGLAGKAACVIRCRPRRAADVRLAVDELLERGAIVNKGTEKRPAFYLSEAP